MKQLILPFDPPLNLVPRTLAELVEKVDEVHVVLNDQFLLGMMQRLHRNAKRDDVASS